MDGRTYLQYSRQGLASRSDILVQNWSRFFRSYTLDFLTSQRLAILLTFLPIMSNASRFISMSSHLRIALTAYLCLLKLLQAATRTPVSVDSILDYCIVCKHEWIDLQHLFAQFQRYQVLFWFHRSAQRQFTVTAPFTLSLSYWQRAFSEWQQTNLALNWGSSSFSIFTHFSNFPVKVNNILGDNGRLRHCLCRVENCNEPTRKFSFLPEVLFTKISLPSGSLHR